MQNNNANINNRYNYVTLCLSNLGHLGIITLLIKDIFTYTPWQVFSYFVHFTFLSEDIT